MSSKMGMWWLTNWLPLHKKTETVGTYSPWIWCNHFCIFVICKELKSYAMHECLMEHPMVYPVVYPIINEVAIAKMQFILIKGDSYPKIWMWGVSLRDAISYLKDFYANYAFLCTMGSSMCQKDWHFLKILFLFLKHLFITSMNSGFAWFLSQ